MTDVIRGIEVLLGFAIFYELVKIAVNRWGPM